MSRPLTACLDDSVLGTTTQNKELVASNHLQLLYQVYQVNMQYDGMTVPEIMYISTLISKGSFAGIFTPALAIYYHCTCFLLLSHSAGYFFFELFKSVADPPSLNLGDSMAEVELHSPAPAALCRVCGKRLDNQRVSYFCSIHAEGLTRAFRLITAGDSHEIQPQKFCNSCYRALTLYFKVEEEGTTTV